MRHFFFKEAILYPSMQWVTCRLNEGNTEFVERKIASKLKGVGGEPYRHFLAAGGWRILEDEVR